MSQIKDSITLREKAKTSRTFAIKLKCLQCCNFETDEVRYCTVTSCALHPFRPYQGNKDVVLGK